jgi:hypothetical protein
MAADEENHRNEVEFCADAGIESEDPLSDAIRKYLRTGETDPLYWAWRGDITERANCAHADLRGALVTAVNARVGGVSHAAVPEIDTAALTRSKIEPMVRGLFPSVEQDAVLAAVSRSVVFLTCANIEAVLFEQRWDRTAWDIANLYLGATGAQLLGEDSPGLVGLSEETTCYVSPDYFAEDDPFADYVVHEVAHIFHNCKRGSIGLRETRSRVWLLEIEYRKRETFAYSCEAYARILERGMTRAARIALAEEYGMTARISDERTDSAEVCNIVRTAAAARNGWKVILSRCAPMRG